MPAVGKSTVGVVVAKRLGMEFIDTDLLIQKQEGRLLREIIADVGEDGFLAIENQVNCQVNAERAVISPGGSVVYCEEAMKHFKEIGTVVYLKASYRTIKERIRSPKKRGVVLREGQTSGICMKNGQNFLNNMQTLRYARTAVRLRKRSMQF